MAAWLSFRWWHTELGATAPVSRACMHQTMRIRSPVMAKLEKEVATASRNVNAIAAKHAGEGAIHQTLYGGCYSDP